MKKIILVAVAAAAVAAPAHADSAKRDTAASTYVVERPDSSERSRERAKVIVLRDRRDAQVATLPRVRPH